MSLPDLKPALRTPSFKATRAALALGAVLLALAAPSTALGLPIGIPSVAQDVQTPLGAVDARAGAAGADACYGLATPALPPVPAVPAVPALPVPLPVPAVPALPQPTAAADGCIHAGADGIALDAQADAAGLHAGTGAQVDAPVDEAVGAAHEATHEAKGFLERLMDTLFGWL